ncbi:MAG: 4'-phosphopantetheinyl transferase superfamily protein [Akkermansia sp.]|nr:4'-phosphopantetheinyl transferase superfamily protein [Akkermansia sp.]
MTYFCYRFADLPAGAAEQALLSADELELAAARGPRYLAARANLRRELGRMLHRSPESLPLTYSKLGKPQLADSALHFNQSHSGDYLCLAVHNAPVGVDIQQIRPTSATKKLAARIMHPQQLQAWQARGASPGEFFACWCAAEALVKHAAAGIWHAQNYPFLWQSGRIRPLFDHAPEVRCFTPAPGYCGAIAYTVSTSLSSPSQP